MNQSKKLFELNHFLPYRMAVAAERLSAGMAKRYRNEFGISVAEWRVLVHVSDAGEVSIREIQSRVHLEKSKASRATSRLEASGYLSKSENPADRRLLALSLTPKGKALMSELLAVAQEFQARLDLLIGADKAAFDKVLDTFMEEDL